MTAVHVRTATEDDVSGIARVHVDAWRETYPGMLPERSIASATYEQREEQWRAIIGRESPSVFVADAEGSVIGFCAAGPNREPDEAHPGELWAIYLLRAHQGRGIGRALFEAARERLRDERLEPFLLWVLEGNPACAFYERLGGRCFVRQPTDVRGANVVERGYEWPESDDGERMGEPE